MIRNLLDSNIFMYFARNLNRLHLLRVLLWFEKRFTEGTIYSIPPVQQEITDGNDILVNWAITCPVELFDCSVTINPLTEEVIKNTALKRYNKDAVNKFIGSVDYFLVAQALQDNACLVTNEVSSESKEKIKMPDICNLLDIPCIDGDQLLANLGYIFGIVPTELLEDYSAESIFHRSGL